MSSFRSVVERTVHLQLQHFTNLRAPVPLFTAAIVFASFSIAGGVSSVSALATQLRKALTRLSKPIGIPLVNTLFDIFTRALNAACLHTRVHFRLPIQWQNIFNRDQRRYQTGDTYTTPHAKAKYWRVAERYRRRLYSGNSATSTPLVTYYTPRLLPMYRNLSGGKRMSGRTAADTKEGWISPRTFCKWHRMVFQDSRHPTLAQAAVQMKYYSHRDLQEIQRITKLLSDEQVFAPKQGGIVKVKEMEKYREMWKSWLENKGMDLVIVFE